MKSQYKVDSMKFSDLESSVNVPKYQRRLVWSERQKESFIENISRGYPFGSILLYRYEDDKKQSLIDGLQRYSTLRDYKQNPAKYFKGFDEFVSRMLEGIEEGGGITLSDDQKDALGQQIEGLLRKCLEQGDSNPLFLRESVKGGLPIYPSDSKHLDDLIMIQFDLKRAAGSYLDLDDLVIPCVVFTGDESQLPDVFANLNQGGTKLSKYQVLAAHWTKHDFRVPDSECGKRILEKVIGRYERLEENRELIIEGFDGDEMEKSRTINLSEYCFALGELITEAVPVFWQSAANAGNDKSEDTFNVVGYLTTAIALGVDNRRINKLPGCIDLFQSEDFVDRFTECILEEYEVIQREFEKWLRKPGKNAEYESGAVTDLQALSFFAALWHKHYAIDREKKRVEALPHYKDSGYEKTRKNLVAHCIADVVSRKWQGSGDSRLANFYVADSADARHSYAAPLSEGDLGGALSTWYDEISQAGSVNIEKVSKMLLCVYTAPDITKYRDEKYDIEHVISRQNLKANAIYSSGKVPGGTLGNLMYLNPRTNRGKKQHNLYILQDNNQGVSFDSDYLGMLAYPTEKAIFEAEESLRHGDPDDAKKLIVDRGREMITRIAKSVCG